MHMLWILPCSEFICIYILLSLKLNSVNVADKSLQDHDFIMNDHQGTKMWPTNLLLTQIFLFNVAADSPVRP